MYRGGVKGFLDAPTTSPYFDYNVPATDNSDSEEGEEQSEGSYWFRWQSLFEFQIIRDYMIIPVHFNYAAYLYTIYG